MQERNRKLKFVKGRRGCNLFLHGIEMGYSYAEAKENARQIESYARSEYLKSLRVKRHDHEQSKASITTATIEFQGSVLRVKTHRIQPDKRKVFGRNWQDGTEKESAPAANKHAITEFSRSSRRTLQDKLMSLSDKALVNCKFVTLTYHESIPEPDVAKSHLRAFYKRVVRYCEKRPTLYAPAMFWRIEVKARQSGQSKYKPAPHFHLFLFGIPYIPKMTLLRWWNEITGDESITQLYIRRLDNRRKVMNYVSKYVSKDEAAGSLPILDVALYLAEVGRHWGFEGKENIPFAPIQTITMHWNCEQIQQFVRFTEELFPFLLNRWSYGYKLFFFGSEKRDIVRQVYQNLIPDFDNPRWGWVATSACIR